MLTASAGAWPKCPQLKTKITKFPLLGLHTYALNWQLTVLKIFPIRNTQQKIFFRISLKYSVNKTNNASLIHEIHEVCDFLPDGRTAMKYSLDNVYIFNSKATSRSVAFNIVFVIGTFAARRFLLVDFL